MPDLKVCGLCATFVEDCYNLEHLTDFVSKCLSMKKSVLPSKVCMDCYHSLVKCECFFNSCVRSMEKIKRNKIPPSLIIGEASIEAQKTPIKRPNSASANISEFVDIPSKRYRRSFKKEESIIDAPLHDLKLKMNVSVHIDEKEQTVARSALGQSSKKKTKDSPVAITPPSRFNSTNTLLSRKRNSTTPSSSPVNSANTSSSRRRSSQGGKEKRVIFNFHGKSKLRRNGEHLPSTPYKSASNNLTKPRSEKQEKRHTSKLYVSRNMRDKLPKSKQNKRTRKVVASTVEDVNVKDNIISKSVACQSYPDANPYQCEVCHKVTIDKKEFIDHIKQYHRNVIDEDVLESLEDSLRCDRIESSKTKKDVDTSPVHSSVCDVVIPPDVTVEKHKNSSKCVKPGPSNTCQREQSVVDNVILMDLEGDRSEADPGDSSHNLPSTLEGVVSMENIVQNGLVESTC